VVRALELTSLALALGALLTLAVLIARRSFLARAERRRREAEKRLRPLAIALVEDEPVELTVSGDGEASLLAEIMARYSRALQGDSRVRIAAFFEQQGQVERELGRLAHRRAWRRAAAAFALGDMGSSRAVSPLIAALGDRDREVRTAAARSLGRLGAVPAAPGLVEALASGAVPRAVAGQALIAIGPAAAAELHPLLGSPDESVRRAAAEVLGLIGGGADAPLLATAARDPAAEVRGAALRALGKVGGKAESGVVHEALHDRVPFVRTAAAHAAAGMGDRSAVPVLIEQARGDRYDPALAASRALVALDPRGLIEAAERNEAGPFLRQAATRAMLAG
jgi:HEAT repeat protein